MGSQRKQVFSRVSFFGGFLTQNSEAFLGHFLVKPLQEASADPCSAWPALRPALNCSAETTHKRASADTDTCAPTYELPHYPKTGPSPLHVLGRLIRGIVGLTLAVNLGGRAQALYDTPVQCGAVLVQLAVNLGGRAQALYGDATQRTGAVSRW